MFVAGDRGLRRQRTPPGSKRGAAHDMPTSPGAASAQAAGPRYSERALLLTLAAIQVTHVLDFMILMPLGPQLMRVLWISPVQFSLLVSAYSVSAAVSGLLCALYVDRFDRKHALLGLYAGFALATLLCALAPTFPLLLAARLVAGAFGGVVGATVYSIVGRRYSRSPPGRGDRRSGKRVLAVGGGWRASGPAARQPPQLARARSLCLLSRAC